MIYIKRPINLYGLFLKLWSIPETRILYLSVATVRLAGKLVYYITLLYVKASFMDIISITSPIFSMIIVYIFKNQKTPLKTIATTIPIMIGVGLCTSTDTEINLFGLIGALATTVLFSLSNILTKSLLNEKKIEELDIALLSDITSLVMMIPVWIWSEILNPSMSSQSFSLMVLWMLLLNGLGSFIQTICSFSMLTHFSALSYTLLNISKRVVVIVGTVIYFGTEFSNWAIFGTSLALFGIFMYSIQRN